MTSAKRQKNVKLPSLGGDLVLATPAEHLANMEKTLAKHRKQRDEQAERERNEWYVSTTRIDFNNEYRFDAWQTKSLISPYMGHFHIVGVFVVDGKIPPLPSYHFRFLFAARNEEWKLKKIEESDDGESWWEPGGSTITFLNQLR